MDVVPNLRQVSGTGMKVCTGTGGAGIHIVPNVPKCPVPVFMPYRTYSIIRYRYWCRTALIQVSGTGNNGVVRGRYASIRTVPNTPCVACCSICTHWIIIGKKVKNKNGVSVNFNKDNNFHIPGWFLCESYSELQILVGSVKQILLVQNETGVMCEIGCGDGTRVICFVARVNQQFVFLDI